MRSKKKRLIIGMVGIFAGLAAAGCGAADTPGPNQVVTADSTPNFNNATSNDNSREGATGTTVPAIPTATATLQSSNDTNKTDANATEFAPTVGPTTGHSGVEGPSAPTPQIANRSTRQANPQPQAEPTAAEPVDTPTETPETVLGSTRDVEPNFRQYRQLIPRDAIEPVYRPQFLAGQSVALGPQDLVIGVAINGESKAYPVGPLNFREMVNDVVGGVPILVTW